jgi:phosphate transport system permease protein
MNAKRNDKIMTGVFTVFGWVSLIVIVVMTGYILIKGFTSFQPVMLTATSDGILNQLFNTVYLVALSLLISVPIGTYAGVYLAEYAKPGRFLNLLNIAIESLSSLPSIVIGLFGYLVFILMTGMKWNLFAGALAVSILSLPLITTTVFDALKSLDPSYKEGALALGATHSEAIRHILLPAVRSQIMTGVIMAAGRGIGEAAALLYTAGQSTRINWGSWWNLASPSCPLNPFRSGETLSLHVWVLRTEGSLNPLSNETAWFASAVLVLITLIFSIVARRKPRKKK